MYTKWYSTKKNLNAAKSKGERNCVAVFCMDKSKKKAVAEKQYMDVKMQLLKKG